MTCKKFTYTKAGGAVSQRTVLVLKEPSKNVFGIDATELSRQSLEEFLSAAEKIDAAHKLAIAGLMDEYDLNHGFRQFIPENMSNVEIIK